MTVLKPRRSMALRAQTCNTHSHSIFLTGRRRRSVIFPFDPDVAFKITASSYSVAASAAIARWLQKGSGLGHAPNTRLLVECPNPDISETYRLARITVCLQLNWRGIVFLVERSSDVTSFTERLKMILYQDAIEENRDKCWSLQRAVAIEDGSGPHHVVALPLPGLTIRVNQWNALLVDAACLAVDIRLVVV